MRVFVLMTVLLSAWVARGEAPYELASVQPWEKKDVSVELQALEVTENSVWGLLRAISLQKDS